MRRISAEILDEIQERCQSINQYRVCIYCDYGARAEEIQVALLGAWRNTRRDMYSNGDRGVFFAGTGSTVRIISGTNPYGLRGYRCNEIYLDVSTNISQQLETRLLAMVRERTSPLRGYRADSLIIDDIPWTENTYECFVKFKNGSTIETVPVVKVPDLGEFVPSQELTDYVSALVGAC